MIKSAEMKKLYKYSKVSGYKWTWKGSLFFFYKVIRLGKASVRM